MGNQVSISDVNDALLRIKSAVASGRYQFINRRKNLTSLAAAGLLPKHVIQYILGLTYKQYLHGPEQESDASFFPGLVFVFGCQVCQDEFFVKVKLYQQSDEEWCTCLSFHIAEKPLYYPYGT